MPIDTSSYYPEVNGPDEDNKDSLNGRYDSLFGQPAVVEEIIFEEEIKDINSGESQDKKPEATETKWEKGVTIISHILSWLLVPIVIPVLGILFILRLSYLEVLPAGLQTAVTFVIAGINFFAPLLFIILLKTVGVVQDVGLNGQKERLIPYVITTLCYGASAWFVASRGAPVWVAMFFCGGALAALINLCINFKWKISAHAAAMAGLIALLIRLQRDVAIEPQTFVWLIICIGATGLLGSARVWLKRHTVWQVLAGYIVGFCSVFFMMYIH